MQKHVKKESNMQTALQKLIMTLKINHIHMKKQHNIPKSFIPKPQHHKIMKYLKTTCLKEEKAMEKKKTIIITTAVIILCIITLILGIKVVQKKKEVQTKQELIQSQEDLINYIKNDGMNVENKDIYIIRIEKTTTKEELDPIRQEYEKEAEVLREAIEADKAELIEQIVERGYIGEEEVSKYTTELKEIRTNEEYEKKKVEIEEAERKKEVEVKEEVKEEIGQLEYISTEEYIEQIEEAESKGEIESIKKEAQEADEAEESRQMEEARQAARASIAERNNGSRQIGGINSTGSSSSSSSNSSNGTSGVVGGSSSSSSGSKKPVPSSNTPKVEGVGGYNMR